MKPSTKVATEIYFNFQIRTSRTNLNGECPIVFRIIYRGQRKDVFTGLFCPAELWLKEECTVSRRYPASSTINHQMHKILANAEHHFNRLKFIGEEFTLDDLVNEMKGNIAPPQTLQEYIDLKEKDIQKRIGFDIKETTWYKYKRTLTYLREYIRKQYGSRTIPVSKVDVDFINGFHQFLRMEKQNSHNSCSALMCCLKATLLPAVKNRSIKENPFDRFVMKREQRDRGFLELHELKALEELEGLSQALALKRDAFLFACYTGLPYSDLKKLNRTHVLKDNDGMHYIKISRTKNNEGCIIPLLPKAISILSKYSPTKDIKDFQWTIPSNQKFNDGLKVLAKLASIEKTLFVHLARHTFATTITLSNGVSLESVAKMLGHSSIKHTQVYAKVVARKVKGEMMGVMGKF
jgi:site-specific recombinase XerD